MIDKIYNVLSKEFPNMEINYLIRPEKFPGISYHIITNRPDFYGDGIAKTEFYSVQIDVWDKTSDNNELINKIKNTMKTNMFRYSRQSQNYEDDLNIFHNILVFNFYEEVIENE